MTCAQNAISAGLDLCACHDPGPRCPAIKAETTVGKRVRAVRHCEQKELLMISHEAINFVEASSPGGLGP